MALRQGRIDVDVPVNALVLLEVAGDKHQGLRIVPEYQSAIKAERNGRYGLAKGAMGVLIHCGTIAFCFFA